MAIETFCPGCSRKLRVDDEFAGKQARCPVCNEIYTVSGENVVASENPPRDADTWRLRTPEGQIYGPVAKSEMDRWVSDGRVTSDCYLAPDESNWDRAEAVYPVLAEVRGGNRVPMGTGTTESPAPSTGGYPQTNTTNRTRYRYTAAHRGGLILALGVISWVVGCPIFGVFAWVMGSGDLREMRLGRMDPSGMGLTQAGQIIGMLHSILVIIGLVLFVFFMLMAVVAG